MLPAGVEVEPAIVADRDEGGFKLVLELPPLRRDARLRLDRNLAEIGLEHEIDDALGRGIAIFERDLLGENLDLGDRFGRDVAHRAEARNAPPVDEEDRSPAAPAARTRLRLERVEQFLDRRGAQAGDRRFLERSEE